MFRRLLVVLFLVASTMTSDGDALGGVLTGTHLALARNGPVAQIGGFFFMLVTPSITEVSDPIIAAPVVPAQTGSGQASIDANLQHIDLQTAFGRAQLWVGAAAERKNVVPTPYTVGQKVRWKAEAPDTWRFIYTDGPMVIVGVSYHEGTPSEYARKFHPDGMSITPGFLYTVRYPADSTDYYDPPLSFLLGQQWLEMIVHEKWLEPE